VEHLEGALVLRLGVPTPSVDLFLEPRRGGAALAPPSPGPTLSVVLSSASASRTIRLPPVHDVRGGAVRVPLGDAARRALEEHAGPWRAQARLGGRLVAEQKLLAA
jgi:hypothetical protein